MQLWNFGHVVDRVGGCGAAWSAALSRGESDGPIRAMAACGDRAAVAYAQHLDGTNIWVGAVFILAAALLAWFMVVSGWAVLRVSVMAIWTTVILLPTLWLGAVPGATQRRAADVVWQFFSHSIHTLIYIVYVSVVGLAVERIVSAPLPAELGGTNPFAHVLMMGGVAMAALMLLRHIRTDVSGRSGGRGLWRQAAGVAVGMGMTAALGGAGTAAAQGIRGLRRRSDSQGEPAPWERMDAQAASTAAVHGAPQFGFDPVPALGGVTGMGVDKSQTRERRGTDDHGSNDRAVLTGEQTAAIDDTSNAEPGVAPMTDQPGPSGTSARQRETQPWQGPIEPRTTAIAPDEAAPSTPAITDTGRRGLAPLREELGGEEPSLTDEKGEPPVPPPDCD